MDWVYTGSRASILADKAAPSEHTLSERVGHEVAPAIAALKGI